jgi:transposase
MPRHATPVNLTENDQQELERWVAAHLTPQQVSQRCRIVLAAAGGQPDKFIADDLGINFKTVALWRKRFVSEGPDCLWEVAEGRGRKPTLTAKDVERIVDATLQTKPAGATHWSCRSMAKVQGVSKATVNRIWQSHQIKPHRAKGFKLSRDPNFLLKLTDVVGLYLNPPEKALVLCVDEKSQIQALDRTQPGLPLKKGRCGTMTHDYKRNGTATLFAALNTLDGKVISLCQERHRHQEWLRFLRLVNEATPEHKQLHLIVDNYATHKHPAVRLWLKRHKRFHLHFTPTSASWLNMVERFFRDLTANRLRRGVFRDVLELVNAIDQYVDRHNENPKPFIWTKSANDILEKVKRARTSLVNVQSV